MSKAALEQLEQFFDDVDAEGLDREGLSAAGFWLLDWVEKTKPHLKFLIRNLNAMVHDDFIGRTKRELALLLKELEE